jgi:CAAX protease family protein
VPAVESLATTTLVASAILLLAVLTLWAKRWIWAIAVAGAVLSGYVAGILHGPAAVWLLGLAASAWRLRTTEGWIRVAWIGLAAVLGLLLGLHVLPGFSNPVVLRDVVLAQGARPYSQYINFDKTLGAVLFLGCSGWTAMQGAARWGAALRRAAPLILATVVGTMAASLALAFVRFEPRWLPVFWAWAPINLLTTCVSEEAFFRGLVQNEVQGGFSRVLERRPPHAVVVSAALFGLAHAAGGWQYVLVATLAGCGYAIVYRQTMRLEMTILAHFAVNAAHFLLFTYPSVGVHSPIANP